MNKMKIAVIAPVWESVPPTSYGGTELVVSLVTEELVRRGHDVTLFATADSVTAAELKSVISSKLSGLDSLLPGQQTYDSLKNIENAFVNHKNFDVIHDHTGALGTIFSNFVSTPTVATIHSIIRPAQEGLYTTNDKVYYCSISNSFREYSPQVKYWETVYNGIDISNLHFSSSPENYFVNIGRMVPDKGFKEAAVLAKACHEKIKIAAPIYSNHGAQGTAWLYDKKYWEEDVSPLIDGIEAEYVGEVTVANKSDFYGKAKALLFPLQWDEPFGLTVVEAMACGTPVITYDRGAMSELVEDGVTGFVLKPGDTEGMIRAIKNIDRIDRAKCRQRVEDNFTVEKMVDRYENVYHSVIADFKKNR